MATDVLKQIWPEWQIEGKPLGKGSFGVVYKAVRRDHNVESYAAIKVISIPADASEIDSLRSEGLDMNATRTYLHGIVDDFVSEIQLMESLKGIQNIVSVEDYRVVEKTDEIGWDIYIRMELLTPFNAYICDKKLTEKEVIKLGCDICTALEICSKRNIIHRDIKPENIFINDFGHFKLGDFGIARKLENMTGGLSQKGTYNYMAPEVANSSDYDARVDTYSLGIVLYRLLNGNRLPFLDTEKQLLNPNERKNAVDRRLRGEELPAPCDASEKMANLILRACAFNPEGRFASAAEMHEALKAVEAGTYAVVELDKTTAVRSAKPGLDATTAVRKATGKGEKTGSSAIGTFGDTPKKAGKGKKAKVIAIAVLAGIVALVVTLAIMFFSSAAFGVSRSMNADDFESALTDYRAEVKGNFIQETLLNTLLKDSVSEVAAEYDDGDITLADAVAELDALQEMRFDGAADQSAEIKAAYADKILSQFESGEIAYERAISELNMLKEMDCAEAESRRMEIMSAHANQAVSQYESGKMVYNDAIGILNTVKADGYTEVDALIKKVTDSHNADNAMEKADEYYQKGDYEKAISEYSKVPEGNENYQEAKNKLDQVYADYIDSVVKKANEYNAAKKYKEAINYVNTAYNVLPDSVNTSKLDAAKEENLAAYKTEIANEVAGLTEDAKWSEAFDLIDEAIAFDDNEYFRDLRTSTEAKYANSVTETVDNYLQNFEYTKALNAVKNARKLLPENDILEKLEKRVQTSTPVYLDDVFLIDSKEYSYNSGAFTDSFGKVYDGYHWFEDCYYGSYAIYNLDQKYSTFNCSIVASTNTGSSPGFSVYIYLDGNLAYSLTDYYKTTGKKDVSLDVSNVTKLYIKVTATTPYYDDNIALVNASLME